MLSAVLMTLLLITAMFLILLVLVQRGKGGGLAGAFGGMGGQSAFGTKAGDLFTRVTIGVATFWILLCLFSVWSLTGTPGRIQVEGGNGGPEAPIEAPADSPAADTGSGPAEDAPATPADAPASPADEADDPAAR